MAQLTKDLVEKQIQILASREPESKPNTAKLTMLLWRKFESMMVQGYLTLDGKETPECPRKYHPEAIVAEMFMASAAGDYKEFRKIKSGLDAEIRELQGQTNPKKGKVTNG